MMSFELVQSIRFFFLQTGKVFRAAFVCEYGVGLNPVPISVSSK
jgi:hypothetical protein